MAEHFCPTLSEALPRATAEEYDQQPSVSTDPKKASILGLGSRDTSRSCVSQSSSDVDTSPEKYAVLRVECIDARSLKVR